MPLRNRKLEMGKKPISGLADGEEPQDAVTLSQLEAVETAASDALVSHETTYHSPIADQRIMANISGASGQPIANTLSAIVDDIVGTTQGAILYRDASGWTKPDPGTADYYLKTGGAGANPSWAEVPPPDWTVVRKTADQAITSSTTLVNDNELTFSVAANTTYAIKLAMFVVAGAAVAGAKIGINGPASPTSINATRLTNTNITGVWYLMNLFPTATAYSTPLFNSDSPQVIIPMRFDILFKNGANAGTFSVQIAQSSSSGTATTFQAGSYLEYMEI